MAWFNLRRRTLKKLNINKIIPFFVTTLIFGYVIFFSMQRKTILVIHSYGDDYAWVRDVNIGINRSLGNQTAVSVRWHYMNTKNHPDKAYKIKAGTIARKVIEFVKPDVLLAIDDDAQEYVAQHYKNTPNMYVVHAGINALPSRYGYDNTAKNVVGILERLPIKGLSDAILEFAAQKKMNAPVKVSHVSDNSLIVQFDDFNMRSSPDWHPLILGKSFLCNTFDDWKKTILEADKNMDFMLISNYRKIARSKTDATLVPYKEVMKWAFEHSPVPIIGINGFVCEDGSAISIATSPFEQGEVAAEMALNLANGRKKIQDIANEQSQQYIVVIDESRLKKSGIILPGNYKAFAKAINKYFSETAKS